MGNIKFGIDLGTTNSAIAKYENGQLNIYKNPVGFKDTLASVVSFRKGRIQVGDKAREQIVKNPLSVFSSFKRKMGTEETYYVKDIDSKITPIELSSKILKELTNFVTDEVLHSVVITIPASFDTIQSNATKKAGYLAGIKEVVLLQEPIAACLAYSNNSGNEIVDEKKWLVYDFGGGTFDVALVNINHRELKIIDHKGNNFLGGLDIDNLLVEKIISPQLEKELDEVDLWKKMIASESDIKYKKLYIELLFKAEEIKKELSLKETALLEIDIDELDLLTEIEITIEDFNKIIAPKFEETYNLVEKLLKDNSLLFSDIEKIIMVGGTTYIPYIRKELKQRTNVIVDTTIDPTTAVVVGAAFYAGNKISKLKDTVNEAENTSETTSVNLDVKWIYETSTKDEEELITAVIESGFEGFYRIIRQDGGFDSTMKNFKNKFSEFVPLLTKTNNVFKVNIYDRAERLVLSKNDINIANGFYNISGQPLPNDISIELDDEDGKSYLEQIFKKNQILPLKKTIYKTSSKTIKKNSDDKLIINIVEGHGGNMPSSNLSIGYIELLGKDFSMDLLRGMEVEIEFEMSESRDLSISVYISSLDIEINEVFNPHEKSISTNKITDEIKFVINEVLKEKEIVEIDEDFKYLAKLQTILEELTDLYHEGLDLIDDNATGRKYQLDDKKRAVIQQYDSLVKSKQIIEEIDNYNEAKNGFINHYLEEANESQKKEYHNIVKNEKEFLASMNKFVLKRKTKQLNKLGNEVYMKKDDIYYDWFFYFKMKELSEFENPIKANKLLRMAEVEVDKRNIKLLKPIINELYQLLIEKPKGDNDKFTDGNLGLR